jgi:hypothetical protein
MTMQQINVGDWVKHPAWGLEFGPVLAVGHGVVAVLLLMPWQSKEIESYVHLEADVEQLCVMERASARTVEATVGMLRMMAAQFEANARAVQEQGDLQ